MTSNDDSEATIISVKGLRLDSVSVPNIWGDVKPQPAYLDVSIHLRDGFNSAASSDALDDSTIHYGELSKKLRAGCAVDQDSIMEAALRASNDMQFKPRLESGIASLITIELVLPKATAYGDALILRDTHTWPSDGNLGTPKRYFTCKGLKIMTLIGVNEYERRGKQALVVDCTLYGLRDVRQTSREALAQYIPLEREFVAIVEATAFETLESLADHVVENLRVKLRERGIVADGVHVRFEKPSAIPFADAPVIEVRRRLA